MKNVKDEVFGALLGITKNTSDLYPTDWKNFPAIQFIEEENKVVERTGNKEDMAQVRYRIDIWSDKSTSELAMKVDAAIAALGLVRTGCMDAPEPSNLKHKVMRYEGIVDMNSDIVYWNN